MVLHPKHMCSNESERRAKGFCQVKIITKIREKLGLVGPNPPTPLSIFLKTF